jgi:hypothetical protein
VRNEPFTPPVTSRDEYYIRSAPGTGGRRSGAYHPLPHPLPAIPGHPHWGFPCPPMPTPAPPSARCHIIGIPRLGDPESAFLARESWATTAPRHQHAHPHSHSLLLARQVALDPPSSGRCDLGEVRAEYARIPPWCQPEKPGPPPVGRTDCRMVSHPHLSMRGPRSRDVFPNSIQCAARPPTWRPLSCSDYGGSS